MKFKKTFIFFMCVFMALYLSGCTGVPNPATKIFDDGQRWTAKELDIFFDWDDKYYCYENGSSPNVGCIRQDGIPVIFFSVGIDSGANMDFFTVQSNEFIANGYFLDASDDYTYRIKIGHSNYEEFLPIGAILTFTREDITEDELFMPDVLGEYVGPPPSTLLPADSSSSNSSTS